MHLLFMYTGVLQFDNLLSTEEFYILGGCSINCIENKDLLHQKNQIV